LPNVSFRSGVNPNPPTRPPRDKEPPPRHKDANASKMSVDHGKPLPIFEVDATGQLAPIQHPTWQFPLSGDGKKLEKTGTGQRARADYSKLTVEFYDAPLVVTMDNLPPDGVRLSSWLEGELLALAYEKGGIVGDELQSRWPYNFRERDPVTYAF